MPDKHEVGGSSPLGPTSFLKGSTTNKTTEYLVHKLLLGGRVVLVGACAARTNVH